MAVNKFYGSVCKGDCSGHRAGYNYVNGGGIMPSPHSPSFNNGMNIAINQQAQANTGPQPPKNIKPRRTP